jgi:hypothetical protein
MAGPFAPRDVKGVSREESAPHQKATEKFHFGGIPAHVNSVRMGDFRELFFGTAPENAALADRRRWRRRRTGPGEAERRHQNFF